MTMSKLWKGVCMIALLMAVAALGVSISALRGETPTARSDEPVYIDLGRVMLKYDDPLRGMSGSITYKQVFEDALWYQINNPQVSKETRVEAFAIVGLMHENRGTAITEVQYVILMDAVQQVWGPAIVAILEDELQ
jgi:hypothetical protein